MGVGTARAPPLEGSFVWCSLLPLLRALLADGDVTMDHDVDDLDTPEDFDGVVGKLSAAQLVLISKESTIGELRAKIAALPQLCIPPEHVCLQQYPSNWGSKTTKIFNRDQDNKSLATVGAVFAARCVHARACARAQRLSRRFSRGHWLNFFAFSLRLQDVCAVCLDTGALTASCDIGIYEFLRGGCAAAGGATDFRGRRRR